MSKVLLENTNSVNLNNPCLNTVYIPNRSKIRHGKKYVLYGIETLQRNPKLGWKVKKICQIFGLVALLPLTFCSRTYRSFLSAQIEKLKSPHKYVKIFVLEDFLNRQNTPSVTNELPSQNRTVNQIPVRDSAHDRRERRWLEIQNSFHNVFGKEELYLKLAEESLNDNDTEQAFQMIKKTNAAFPPKDDFYKKLAQSFFNEGKKEQALLALEKVNFDIDFKDNLYELIVERYITEGNKEQAFEVAKKTFKIDKKFPLYEKIGEAYINENDLAGAFEFVQKITSYNNCKLRVLLKLAENYLKVGNPQRAFEVALLIEINRGPKEELLVRIVNRFLEENNYNNALEGILSIIFDSNARASLLTELVKKHLSAQDVTNALKVVHYMSDRIDEKQVLLIQILQRYHANNQKEDVEKMLGFILMSSYAKTLENGITNFKPRIESLCVNEMKKEYARLATKFSNPQELLNQIDVIMIGSEFQGQINEIRQLPV